MRKICGAYLNQQKKQLVSQIKNRITTKTAKTCLTNFRKEHINDEIKID